MISLVIPCFNETAVLDLTWRTLLAEADKWKDSFEIVFVDDGSRDDTWSIIERLAAQDSRVRGVRLSRNFGHQAAVGAGLEQARGEAVIILDADLQDPPGVITEMLERWRQGFDVVAARRNRREGESRFKKVLGYCYYRVLARVTNVNLPIDTGDFALLDRRVVRVLLECREHAMYWRGLRCYAGFKHTEVRFDRPSRAAGESKYTLRKLIQLASNGLLSYSDLPLRLGLYAGLAGLSVTALLTLVALVCLLIPGASAPIPLAGLGLWFLGSVQLLCIGIIGEYLNRIYAEVRNRPRWVVMERVGIAEAAEQVNRAA